MDPGLAPLTHMGPKRIDSHQVPSLLASTSHDSSQQTNFFRSCTLCADGSVAMAHCEDRTIEFYSVSSHGTEQAILPQPRRLAQSENILGTLWYPTATPQDPASFCFLTSVRECPVKLLDASDGRIRASYKIVDHRERYIAPNSMALNCMASKLYCGFQDAIEVFDVNRPGEGGRIFTTPTKKSRSGLKGIISSLAFCPDYSGLYAAGTFSSSLVLFSESSDAEIIQWLGGVMGPVTQVKFNPMQPHILYGTSRQTDCILAWDIRGDTSAPLQRFERYGLTNQRLNFDLDVHGKTLVTGDQNGFISIFGVDDDLENPATKFKAHDDAVAAATVHPLEPILISVSGSRHFGNISSEAPSASSELELESSSDDSTSRTRSRPQPPFSKDTSLKLWKLHTLDTVGFEAEAAYLTE